MERLAIPVLNDREKATPTPIQAEEGNTKAECRRVSRTRKKERKPQEARNETRSNVALIDRATAAD